MILLLSVSMCGAPTPTATSIPSTQTPPYVLTNTPITESTSTTEPYRTWSTNFANMTDPAAIGIVGAGSSETNASLSLDTANVHSGGKALKVTGTVGAAWSSLNLIFNLPPLIGASSVDLSDKTLSLDMYVPAGSPLYWFTIEINGLDQNNKNQYVQVRRILPDVYAGQWHTYTADVSEDIVLKTWHEWPTFTSSSMTDDQVIHLIENATNISITAQTPMDHPNQQAYFMVDQLGWAPSGPLPVYDPTADSLQKFAPASLPVGGWNENTSLDDPDMVRNFVQEFNMIDTSNQFPMAEPAGDVMNYDTTWSPNADEDILHETEGMKMLRSTGLGLNPAWVPDWLPGKNYTDTKSILEGYIRALVGHYKGQTYIWNLFNELLGESGPFNGYGVKYRKTQGPFTHTSNYSPWSKDPSDLSMIEDAFRVAHQADPQALLIIVDASSAEGEALGDGLYALAAKLKADGTPIDGVGFEAYLHLDQNDHFHVDPLIIPGTIIPFDPSDPSSYGFTSIAKNVERFQALGLKVAFTEVAVPIYLADIDPSTPAGQALLAHRRQLQAEAYRSLLHIALTHPNVIGFNVQSWGDEYTYLDPEGGSPYNNPPGYGKDLGLFDQYFQKKPSYYALLDELKGSTLPGYSTKIAPFNASSDQAPNLTLQWSTTWNAASYEYCLDTSDNKACDTSWVSTGTGTQATLKGLAVGTTYYWQVRARNADGTAETDGGIWWSFKVSSTANQAPGPVLFQDDFNGSLDTGWQWTNENKNHWSLTANPGWLQITTSKGGLTDNTVENLLLRPVPQGNFELETSVRFKPTGNFQAAGLVIYESPSHYLLLTHAYCAVGIGTCVSDGIYFDLITNGTYSGSNFATPAPASSLIYLRLRREGNVYTAYMSVDGTIWTMIGVHLDYTGSSAVGLVTDGTLSTNPVPARFDYFITYGLP
jgi:endo-1,4-beta-xylanase